MHGCGVLDKWGFARPYVLPEHTLVTKGDGVCRLTHMNRAQLTPAVAASGSLV